MAFKSEIRDSTINGLLEKAASRNYGQYLPKLVLKHVRGFNNEPVSFDFPVTALIGPNGGGKTTILGAAGCAYKPISPKRFFAKSGKYDETMQDWSIEYEIIDRDLNKKDAVRRTASFRNQRWNRDAPDRRVLVFGVSRTVPANERPELVRCASNSFKVPEADVQELTEPVRQAVSRILGKNVTGFSRLRVDAKGRVTLLAGRTKDGKSYSEFHFGAGESSTIRMVAEIELVEDQALVLIEEIENGLHPVATVRMVEYLVDAAERKKLQAIFTTHSNDALKPLPSKAIWVATQNRIFQGKLDIHSLRAITGQIDASLVVFVEDPFAKLWAEAILRQAGNIAVDHIQVHGMEGDGTAVAMNRYHRLDPSSTVPSVCLIDGDSKQSESSADAVYRLPGQSPEAFVFDEVMSAWNNIGGKLSVALLQRFEHAERVHQVCQTVRTTNMDSHLLFAQVGERLGLIPEATVAAAFANIWAQACPGAVQAILAPFGDKLPREQK
ncbi:MULTISPECIES: AAA family ATPase [Metallibacterium]|jgi:energy-coupling factor transporter ATP-binding protein EcfA2|uniref:ATP-dependent nuclease n=1 Tax=Metallibacterium TaxID=1218803 RepID=UPI00260A14E0|nr:MULTISPECIES: AAA family ATPase [Metallibacterium]MBW8074538.1 AAA family ATPase [Metallibacterium scheffleri]